MHIRKFIAACALALASMFVISGALAAPADHLMFERLNHDLSTVHDLAPAFTADAEMFVLAASPSAAHKADGNCSDSPAWVGIDTPDGVKAERLPLCNPRRYDPGWLRI